MNTALSQNRHIERNYQENDDFDFFVKAEAIRSFLEFNVNSLLLVCFISLDLVIFIYGCGFLMSNVRW